MRRRLVESAEAAQAQDRTMRALTRDSSLLAEEDRRTAVKTAATSRCSLVHSNDRGTRSDDVATARTFERASRKSVQAFAVVSAVLLPALALATYAGSWFWRSLSRHRLRSFGPSEYCRGSSIGTAAACGSPWSEPCFDRSRCRPGGGGGGGGSSAAATTIDSGSRGRGVRGRGSRAGGGDVLSVYVHDEACSMRSSSKIIAGYGRVAVPLLWDEAAKVLRNIAATRGLLAETPYEACIVFYAVPAKGECVTKTPSWGKGQNHVLVDFNDETRDARPSLNVKAMFAQSNMRTCYYRHGYDIALPLRARKLFHSLRKVAPPDRKYFATFKGSLYLTRNGVSERSAVSYLSRGGTEAADSSNFSSSDVVVVARCNDLDGDQLPENKAMCEAFEREFHKTSYEDLMNTTFALLPSGRSPATYRLGEALSAGALPVFIVQDYVKPFPERIPWSKFSFSFPPNEAPRVLETLRAVSDEELAQMQVTALKVFDEFFGPGMNKMMHVMLDTLEERLSFRT